MCTALMDATLQFDSLYQTDANTAAICWDLERVPNHRVSEWLSQSRQTAEGFHGAHSLQTAEGSAPLLRSDQEQSQGGPLAIVEPFSFPALYKTTSKFARYTSLAEMVDGLCTSKLAVHHFVADFQVAFQNMSMDHGTPILEGLISSARNLEARAYPAHMGQ